MVSILVAIISAPLKAQKRLLQQKPEYEEIFEMMHSSAFINAATGTIFLMTTRNHRECVNI